MKRLSTLNFSSIISFLRSFFLLGLLFSVSLPYSSQARDVFNLSPNTHFFQQSPVFELDFEVNEKTFPDIYAEAPGALSPDGKKYVSLNKQDHVQIWNRPEKDGAAWKKGASFYDDVIPINWEDDGDPEAVKDFSWSPNGENIHALIWGGKSRIYSLGDEEKILSRIWDKDSRKFDFWGPNGRDFYSYSHVASKKTQYLQRWDKKKSGEGYTEQGPIMAISEDGRVFVVESKRGASFEGHLWNEKTQKWKKPIRITETFLRLSEDGKLLASLDGDGNIRIRTQNNKREWGFRDQFSVLDLSQEQSIPSIKSISGLESLGDDRYAISYTVKFSIKQTQRSEETHHSQIRSLSQSMLYGRDFEKKTEKTPVSLSASPDKKHLALIQEDGSFRIIQNVQEEEPTVLDSIPGKFLGWSPQEGEFVYQDVADRVAIYREKGDHVDETMPVLFVNEEVKKLFWIDDGRRLAVQFESSFQIFEKNALGKWDSPITSTHQGNFGQWLKGGEGFVSHDEKGASLLIRHNGSYKVIGNGSAIGLSPDHKVIKLVTPESLETLRLKGEQGEQTETSKVDTISQGPTEDSA